MMTRTLRDSTIAEETIETEEEKMGSIIRSEEIEAIVAKDTRIESGSIREIQILRLLPKCGFLV